MSLTTLESVASTSLSLGIPFSPISPVAAELTQFPCLLFICFNLRYFSPLALEQLCSTAAAALARAINAANLAMDPYAHVDLELLRRVA